MYMVQSKSFGYSENFGVDVTKSPYVNLTVLWVKIALV